MATDEKWYFTKEQLTNTPSRKCGIDADKELSYRQQAANFIQDMGQRLVVSQLCINTAIVYMHRFYVFHSLSQFHRNSIAAAALFLAAKVEEQPRKLEHVIKMAHMCLHRDQSPPDIRSEQYLEQAQDLVFNENVLLQTLGFDVAIDHPHTHVVRCCQLVKASKDLAQTSYFMASNSLHLTTMCLQYKPTVVACFCIHLASKWSNWEIPQSNEGKHWFWYVDRTVTSELLQQLTAEFLHIFDRCPSRLKRKIMSISANQSPNMNHPSIPNSPFDTEPRKIQSPATSMDGVVTFHSNRPHHTDKQDDKKSGASASTRPSVDYRDYREKKERERERLEREKTSGASSVDSVRMTEANKQQQHHSHHHKPGSGMNILNKHQPPSSQQKTSMHHNHHHRTDAKMAAGQSVPQRHSANSGQTRDPSRDPSRQRLAREYMNAVPGATMHSSHAHLSTHSSKESSSSDFLLNPPVPKLEHTDDQHIVVQEKLGNNNHSLHRLNAADGKHQHEKRGYDPRHKLDPRKDNEQKPYSKYNDPQRLDRNQRKPDILEQRCEEVRKLIEKPLPLPKPAVDAPYSAPIQKQHHGKYNQMEKLHTNVTSDSRQSQIQNDKSPTISTSSSSSSSQQKSLIAKLGLTGQQQSHGGHLVSKEAVKNGTSLLNDEPRSEKRLRHEAEKHVTEMQPGQVQTPPAKHKSLFSPEKTVPPIRDTHSQRSKTKQKTPPSAVRAKHERDLSLGFGIMSYSDAPSVQQQSHHHPHHHQQHHHHQHNQHQQLQAIQQQQQQQHVETMKRLAGSDATNLTLKRIRTSSTGGDSDLTRIKTEEASSAGLEAMKMLGRVPDLIQPIKDHPPTDLSKSGSVSNDVKPTAEFLKSFESEQPTISRRLHETVQQHPLTNGLDIKQEPQDFMKENSYSLNVAVKEENPSMKTEYLSSMKSAQSISALLQEPLPPMPSLLQGMQQLNQVAQPQPQQREVSSSEQRMTVDSQCILESSVSETSIASTVDISALSGPTSSSTQDSSSLSLPSNVAQVATQEEKKSSHEHHKSEKKKKEKKHKHKGKDKSKDKHKHKHREKDKDKNREDKEKDKDKSDESSLAVPIKITIPKDKLNLGTESSSLPGALMHEKNKSPPHGSGTGLKIKIPKERLKGSENTGAPVAQPVVQAPLKIKIRTDAISRSGAPMLASVDGMESRKRERVESNSSSAGGTVPPIKKPQMSFVQQQQHRPGERQNGRHYSSGSNNKDKHASSHHKSSSKLSQSQQSHAT
ncbi:cyclin-T-like isoform X5 [Prorops nasuta]|uniref:cyclin-T-like isoform X5 n=1 Tax=Prorops nasuta TaxID=863751 RepID=UPI0034CF804F